MPISLWKALATLRNDKCFKHDIITLDVSIL